MNIFRIGGVVLMVGLALFLISMLAKLLIVGGIVLIALRVIGKQIARRFNGYGPQGLSQGGWASANIISIDNPGYRTPMYQPQYDRAVAPAYRFGRVISVG